MSAFQQVSSQEVLSNQSIIDLVELGFDNVVIINKINNSTTDFDTTIDALKTLKEKNIDGLILSAMILAGKPKTVSDNYSKPQEVTYPKKSGDKFYAKNGYDKLVEVDFLLNEKAEGMSEKLISFAISNALMKARYTLKTRLSFVPVSVYIDKKSEATNTALVVFYGKNSYGAEQEEMYLYKFGNKTDSEFATENLNFDYDENKLINRKYRYEKFYVDGSKVKSKGTIEIGKNYITITMDNSDIPIPILDSQIDTSLDNWSYKLTAGGMESICTFDANNEKYKTDGGVFILDAVGFSKTIYPLIKVE